MQRYDYFWNLQAIALILCVMPLITIGFLQFSVIDLLDIITVAALIYFLVKSVRHTSAMNIVIAIISILIIRVIVDSAGMKMASSIIGALIDVGAIALVVIFQPEIRSFLTRMGGRATAGSFFTRVFYGETRSMDADAMDELAQACFEMAEEKCGALIVLPGKASLDDIISTGDTIDARISKSLIENIFFKNSPLHDGAMVIGADRIIAARCTLPISARTDIPARYGMRHKAAVGISERTDARVIVVSEQTGKIAFVEEGKITAVSNINTLKLLIDNGERKAGS